MKKIVYDITKFTTTDYKDHLSCIVWFASCNMRCLYCYNPDIVLANNGKYTLDELYSFLDKRIGLLDAVVLSGGEATIHELYEVCKTIKTMGFKIKLDTNGTFPEKIKKLVNANLIDYISLDFKATKLKYKEITKSSSYADFLTSLDFLNNNNIEFEVRTTLHPDLLNEDDINNMQKVLLENGYKNNYYIQPFLEVDNLSGMKSSNKAINKSKIENLLNIVYRD